MEFNNTRMKLLCEWHGSANKIPASGTCRMSLQVSLTTSLIDCAATIAAQAMQDAPSAVALDQSAQKTLLSEHC